MCELLIKPTGHYNRIDKFLRGLEKCIMVVTTIDPDGK
jgi:serine/threonine-protein phosphatase 4 regulatory subunit 2